MYRVELERANPVSTGPDSNVPLSRLVVDVHARHRRRAVAKAREFWESEGQPVSEFKLTRRPIDLDD